MMLSGEKQLSVFSFNKGVSQSDAFEQQDFDGAVRDKKIVRENVSFDSSGSEINYVIFAPISQSWRIHGYKILLEFLHTRSWSLELDWIEARMFGLDPKECDQIVALKARADRGVDTPIE